ncbi:cytochrome b/b6 domain-containing protein [Streptantibioticus ferralitis]|uniref:Cytochrome b/b6 domain-containing protein n=1 Tax=Streptantibioticus ferralitis TaxID=236510 RepID=A0ABT5YYF1_9ACTN|nr:cytochrome b/b6 domain-containing protein [Streptantibioticus ferralitis]MDF2256479.1 cytochrome b/b6 domain-containing protein [Streptantibioticus ferralitis]
MPLRLEPPATETALRRFTTAERWIHRTTAVLMGIALLTAAFLYLPALAELVGRRRLLVTVHEWSGLLLPLPLLAGLVSRAFRADLRRLNRFGTHDRRWLSAALRYRTVPRPAPAGKFNAGQKLYAAFVAGAVLVMLGTGLIMWFTHLTPLLWRTGATFVHDWLALVIGVLVAGHLWMASRDPEARRGLRTGWVARAWARREHPLWEKEESRESAADAADGEPHP